MTFDQLKQFRQGVYTILGNAKDALFDLMDAVLVTRSVYSFVELSLSPVFRRQWSSIYEALEDSNPPREESCKNSALVAIDLRIPFSPLMPKSVSIPHCCATHLTKDSD